MMQAVLKRSMLIWVASLFLSPVAAFSQDAGDDDDRDAADEPSQMAITQKQAEQMAGYVYGAEIKAGRLTLKQAGEYYKCSEEDYAARLGNAPLLKRAAQRMGSGKKVSEMSAAEKAALDADNKEAEKLRSQSQDMCVKKLGLKEKPKAVSEHPSKK